MIHTHHHTTRARARSRRWRSALALVTVTAALAPCAASAATVTYEGPADNEVLVLHAAPGERNQLSVQEGPIPDSVTIYDAGVPITQASPLCANHPEWHSVDCHAPNGARLDLGDGDDWAVVSLGVTVSVEMFGGPGNDRLEGNAQINALHGDDGNDQLSGSKGNDTLEGGLGDDTLDGGEGSDRLLGGDGNDLLYPDHYEYAAPDVVDGGPGIDRIDADWSTRDTDDLELDVALTLGGGADDGRPGEGDDITNVERLTFSKGATVTGTDAPEYVKLAQTTQPGKLIGNGGNDELYGGGGTDTVDGGTGDDILNGGFGDDTITGGPGADKISGDQTTTECSYLWCKYPYGNDLIQARDGEIDSIDCGAGQDRVIADAGDVVAPDCETVERGSVAAAAAPPGAPAGGQAGATGTPLASAGGVQVIAGQRLGKVLRKGLKVRVDGAAPKHLKMRLTYAGTTVARATGKPGRIATLRLTSSARRALATRKEAKLTLFVGKDRARVTLAR